MLLYNFINSELNTFISEQRLPVSEDFIKIVCKAFESYDTYKKLCNIPFEDYEQDV